MTRIKLPLVLLLLFFPVAAGYLHGQQNDFQLWPFVKLNVQVVKNLKFHIEEEARFQENVTQLGRQISDAGISYKINKYIRTGVFYRLEDDRDKTNHYSWKNGIYGDLSLRCYPQRFTLEYRLRIQSSKIETTNREASLFDGFRHRHKITAEYNIKGVPISPVLEGELFVKQSAGQGSEISGFRTWIGLNYTIKKVHTITLKYGIDQEYHVNDPLRSYIIAFGYSLDLDLRSN